MESFDVDHSCIELGIRLQKLSKRLRGHIPATRDGDVWMPGTKFGLDASSERRLLHALMNLEYVRVRFTNANPYDSRRTLRRKRSDANDREKEGPEFDRAEFFTQRAFDILRHVAKEAKCQMHMRRLGPADTANMRVEICKQLAHWLRQVNRDEEAFHRHGENVQCSTPNV
jgi:hypothetical protein